MNISEETNTQLPHYYSTFVLTNTTAGSSGAAAGGGAAAGSDAAAGEGTVSDTVSACISTCANLRSMRWETTLYLYFTDKKRDSMVWDGDLMTVPGSAEAAKEMHDATMKRIRAATYTTAKALIPLLHIPVYATPADACAADDHPWIDIDYVDRGCWCITNMRFCPTCKLFTIEDIYDNASENEFPDSEEEITAQQAYDFIKDEENEILLPLLDEFGKTCEKYGLKYTD